MSTKVENQLRRCFELLAKIREGYPEGEFDREMLHGDMDFRFRQIKEMREKLEALPVAVQEFARFKNALRISDEAVKSIFRSVLKDPERFSPLKGLGFQERRKKIEKWAAELEIPAGDIDELLTRTRLAAILDSSYSLNESYREVIVAYLAL